MTFPFIVVYKSQGNSTVSLKNARDKIVYVDFNHSLGVYVLGDEYFSKYEKDQERIAFCQKMWQTNALSSVQIHEEHLIPKVIHQIWLSKEPFPEIYKKHQMTWIKNHPGWVYHLWSEKDISKLPEPIKTKINQAKDIKEKENILKAAILVQIGGVIVDIGFESVKPLDPIHTRYQCYLALEPPLKKGRDDAFLHISPYILGCQPGHPLAIRWQNTMWQKYAETSHQKPEVRDHVCAAKSLEEVVFSQEFPIVKEDLVIIFPPTYFFPLNVQWAQQTQQKNKEKKTKEKGKNGINIALPFTKKDPLYSTVKMESYAVHMNGGYWGYIPKQEREKNKKITKPYPTYFP